LCCRRKCAYFWRHVQSVPDAGNNLNFPGILNSDHVFVGFALRLYFLGFFFSTWAPRIGRKCRVLISYVMTTLLYFFFLPCDSRREFQNQGEERRRS
jgi:hypothetical protein